MNDERISTRWTELELVFLSRSLEFVLLILI